jgi:hypothetical protein
MRIRHSDYFLSAVSGNTEKWSKADTMIEYFQTKDFNEAVAKAKLVALSCGIIVEVLRQEYDTRSYNKVWYCLLLVDERGKVIQ